MFVLTTVHDTIRIPPHLLGLSTATAIQGEIDQAYPNRILNDVGLVIARYDDLAQIGHGVCVAGDGGSHHACSFRLIVFRPFVEEVCLGRILKSTPEGLQVTLGFFDQIFIPAYWMLNPSKYEERSGLWVWTPQYDDDDEEEDGTGGEKGAKTIKLEVVDEEKPGQEAKDNNNNSNSNSNRYEMFLGAEIRFKVKSINFTRVTNTAKGMQATMTSTAAAAKLGSSLRGASFSSGAPASSSADLLMSDESVNSRPVRRRSSSVGLDDSAELPATMHIVASICEDGLGLTNWWSSHETDESQDETMA